MTRIPSEFIIPKRITLTQKSLEKVAELLEKPREPTETLKRLLHEANSQKGANH